MADTTCFETLSRKLWRLHRTLRCVRGNGTTVFPAALLAIFLFTPGTVRGQGGECRFADVTEAVNLRFQHHSPLTPERHLHLFMGSGLAWLDHDRDDWPDLFFCQGAKWPSQNSGSPEHSDQLFRNRGGVFQDITAAAGLQNFEYSMGTAVGDYDNDGFPDLYVSSYSTNRLYHNHGDGTWSEVTDQPALNDERFAASCTWADIDADGDLDLYVANYLQLDPKNYPLCSHVEMGKKYPGGCHPRYQKHEFDLLLRNAGDGSFQDISAEAGLTAETPRAGLGVFVGDMDSDNDLDFYVANDTVHNQLWVNAGNGTFTDDGLLMGVAVNGQGFAEAGMGVNGGDVDGDGRIDLFVTNYFNETNTLYRNDGAAFTDVTSEFGLGAPSKQKLGFGASFLDADNDGWLDLFVANGHVQSYPPELEKNTPFAQLPQFFRNSEGVRFEEVSATSGPYFQYRIVGRSSGVCDFDRDGRIDLAVQHLNGPAKVLRNETENAGNAISLQLTGTRSDRDAIGARIEVRIADRTIVRLCNGSTSYLANDERRVHIGIGQTTVADSIVVHWPAGTTESWPAVNCEKTHYLIEGRGIAE